MKNMRKKKAGTSTGERTGKQTGKQTGAKADKAKLSIEKLDRIARESIEERTDRVARQTAGEWADRDARQVSGEKKIRAARQGTGERTDNKRQTVKDKSDRATGQAVGKRPGTTKKHTKSKKISRKKRNQEYGVRHHGRLIFFMASSTILECGLTGWIHKQSLDQIWVLLFFGFFYSVIFFAGLELYRIQQDWFYEKIQDYKRFTLCYIVSSAAAVLFLFFPSFSKPIFLLSMAITAATTPFLGMAMGIFHGILYTICGQENIYVLLCNLMLVLCGCIAIQFLKKEKYYRWGLLLIFQFTFGNVMIFSYLQTGQLEWNVLSYGLCNGIVSAVGAHFLYQAVLPWLHVPKKVQIERVLSEKFSLVQAIKRFSTADYNHARKVSEIAGNCARIIDADPYIAAAGGFYYRLGRMEGEPYVERGVALAKSNYLPREVIDILKEYNGEKRMPSTVESAIVHIVDSVVAKFDVLDKATLSSSWNQDVIVYQTLNENSAAGLYDKAGFSMNMFLKIRDYLLKEAKKF